MKKIFTLTTLLVVALTVNAQGYRKWDFTNWSATTVENLKTEAEAGVTGGTWSDTEKANGDNPQPGKCFWSYGENISADGYLMANGQVIPETEGLVWNTAYTSRRSLAIAVDYPSTSLGEYGGPQYLWLGGGNAKSASARLACFTIPKVRIGQKITMKVESHKPSDARGVSLFANSCTDDANQIGESFTPTTLDTYTWENWTLPEGAQANDDGETVDVVVYNTNGCHIYSIEVGTADQKSKAAFLYNGTLDEDLAYAQLKDEEKIEFVAVEATGAFTMEAMTAYDCVVISSTVNNAEAIASLKAIIPFVPTLNLNPATYTAWGYGQESANTAGAIIIPMKYANNALFSGIDLIDQEIEVEGQEDPVAVKMLSLTTGKSYKGVLLSDYFANDDVIATAYKDESEAVAIHMHNAGHNAYIFLPYTQEALAQAKVPELLNNAVKMLANSKAKVSHAPKPTIMQEFKNRNTNVSFKSGVPMAQFYYTLDGSEPTEASTLYTEPFNIATEGVTVKAVVKGDGYLLSEVAEQVIELKDQAAMPTIDVEQKNGYALVTLACATEGADIFYNYDALTDSTKSTKYTEPIMLLTGKTLTAFAGNSLYVVSEPATQTVNIAAPYTFKETLSHMDANKQEYYQNFYDSEDKPNSDSNSKVAYFFSWGKDKSAYSYYDTTAEPIEMIVDPETGDETPVYPLNPEEKYDFGNGWAIRSRGQVIVEEITIKPGNAIGDGSGYNPATVDEYELAEDYPCTDIYLNISEWNTSAAPRSGMIYSTQKFKGPFAVISYISNGNSGTGPKCVFETGQDIEGDAVETEWTQVGDICVLDKGQRLYQKFVRFYEGTDEVYLRTRIADGGSKAGYYDIYVVSIDLPTGEGIEDVQRTAVKTQSYYNLNGMRQNGLQRGINIVVDSEGNARKLIVK